MNFILTVSDGVQQSTFLICFQIVLKLARYFTGLLFPKTAFDLAGKILISTGSPEIKALLTRAKSGIFVISNPISNKHTARAGRYFLYFRVTLNMKLR